MSDPIGDHARAVAKACVEAHPRSVAQARKRKKLGKLAELWLNKMRKGMGGKFGAHTQSWGDAFFSEFLDLAEHE